jgi:uncharacterized protein YndB with AHSA1/START domain
LAVEGAGTSLGQVPIHGSFAVERDLAASPDRVFSAYADVSVRRRWFRIPGDPARAHHSLDFRPGGSEESRGVFAPLGDAGPEERISYRSVFWDVLPGSRLVFGYELMLNDVRRWVSLVTVELSSLDSGASTRLRHSEQYVFLAYAEDGAQDVAHLKGSTQLQLNGLAAALDATG